VFYYPHNPLQDYLNYLGSRQATNEQIPMLIYSALVTNTLFCRLEAKAVLAAFIYRFFPNQTVYIGSGG
ncbi:hypothetical protein, partial [Vibrio cholerae]|uniref:hypothetical protein n=1 Tax=Vibrio cholerae TaxID=666 RepID=UPI001F306273